MGALRCGANLALCHASAWRVIGVAWGGGASARCCRSRTAARRSPASSLEAAMLVSQGSMIEEVGVPEPGAEL